MQERGRHRVRAMSIGLLLWSWVASMPAPADTLAAVVNPKSLREAAIRVLG